MFQPPRIQSLPHHSFIGCWSMYVCMYICRIDMYSVHSPIHIHPIDGRSYVLLKRNLLQMLSIHSLYGRIYLAKCSNVCLQNGGGVSVCSHSCNWNFRLNKISDVRCSPYHHTLSARCSLCFLRFTKEKNMFVKDENGLTFHYE